MNAVIPSNPIILFLSDYDALIVPVVFPFPCMDVTLKETLMTFLDMAIGAALTHTIVRIPSALWIAFVTLTALHIWYNIRAMRSLCVRRLNMHRLDLLLEAFLNKARKSDDLPDPQQIARMESLAPPLFHNVIQSFVPRSKKSTNIRMAPSLMTVSKPIRGALMVQMRSSYKGKTSSSKCWLLMDPSRHVVYVFLHHSINSSDGLLQAYCYGRVAVRFFQLSADVVSSRKDRWQHAVDRAFTWTFVDGGWTRFSRMLRSTGWDLSNPALGAGLARVDIQCNNAMPSDECYSKKEV